MVLGLGLKSYRIDSLTIKGITRIVYSMGNIFYKLLTNERKYSYLNVEQAQYEIKKNALPPLSPMLETSVFPVHVALRNAIIMSLQRYPEKRKNAKEIYEYLAAELSKFKEKTAMSEESI